MRLQNKINANFVPFTELEWKKIQSLFLSESVDDLKIVCEILNMWKCRMGSCTPIFIDITELILSSILLDKGSNTELHLSHNANNIRHIYASSIIRFVNYVNEICQPGGTKLLSIAQAVSSLDIPQWIVNVRHQATHGRMPPLNIMRKALNFCQNWLWKHQWAQKFNDAVKELPKELYEIERSKQQLKIFNRIKEEFESFHNWRKKNSSIKEITNEQREHFPFKKLIEFLTNYTDEFLQAFVNLCLSKRKKLHCEHFNHNKNIGYLSDAEQFYYFPIMQILNDKNDLSSLLLEITQTISDSTIDETIRINLSGWANKLLSAYFQVGSPRFETLSDQNLNTLLKHIILAPQFFENELIEKILNDIKPKISNQSFQRLNNMLIIGAKMYDNSVIILDDTDADLSTYSVKTVEDLQSYCNTYKTHTTDSINCEENWSFANMNDLGPLGLTAFQTADTLCLEINKNVLLC